MMNKYSTSSPVSISHRGHGPLLQQRYVVFLDARFHRHDADWYGLLSRLFLSSFRRMPESKRCLSTPRIFSLLSGIQARDLMTHVWILKLLGDVGVYFVFRLDTGFHRYDERLVLMLVLNMVVSLRSHRGHGPLLQRWSVVFLDARFHRYDADCYGLLSRFFLSSFRRRPESKWCLSTPRIFSLLSGVQARELMAHVWILKLLGDVGVYFVFRLDTGFHRYDERLVLMLVLNMVVLLRSHRGHGPLLQRRGVIFWDTNFHRYDADWYGLLSRLFLSSFRRMPESKRCITTPRMIGLLADIQETPSNDALRGCLNHD